MEPAKGC